MSFSVHELKQAARLRIIQSSFEQDQKFTLNRWVDTFIYDDHSPHRVEHQNACVIIKFLLAAIALGDFQIKTDKEYHAPTTQLQLSDYISHSSRVIIDLQSLTNPNYIATLFQIINLNALKARASTHCLEKNEKGYFVENKSKSHGGFEALKGVVHDVGEHWGINALVKGTILQGPPRTDFGINIQMGGFGRPNLSEGESKFGFDGHILMHLSPDSKGLLIGLEQSSPLSSPKNTKMVEDDNSYGLSGAHSLIGTEDDFTSAGSLYFNNLIYKLKLFSSSRCLTPLKYNGMYLKINNENFEEVITLFKHLVDTKDKDQLIALLQQRPRGAVEGSFSEKQFISQIKDSDVDALITQIKKVDLPLLASDQEKIKFLKHKINTIKGLIKFQAPKKKQYLTPLLGIDNLYLQTLNHVLTKALISIHQEYFKDLADQFFTYTENELNANKIYEIYQANKVDTLAAQKLSDALEFYNCYKKIYQDYCLTEEKNIADGFEVFFKFKNAMTQLSTILETPEAKMLLDLSKKIEALELNPDKERARLEILCDELDEPVRENQKPEAREDESIFLQAKKQNPNFENSVPASKASFFVKVTQAIFSLKTLGLISGITAVSLISSLLVPHITLTILFGLSSSSAALSMFCYFSSAKDSNETPIFNTEIKI